MIGVAETAGAAEVQVLPKISPTMEVGALVNPGRAVWVGAGWWVQDVVLPAVGCCQEGRDWAAVAEEKDEVLFF